MTPYDPPDASGHFLATGPYEHITREEVQAIVAQEDELNWRILFQLLWTTGARISEILALTAKDLVREQQQFALQITRLKRKKPFRDVLPIPLELGIKLQDYIRLRELRPADKLFPYTRSCVWRRCQRAGKKVLGKPVSPHMFRHGRVYDLAMRKESPFLMARIFGHANIQTTLAYFHPTAGDIREALED